MTRVTRSRQAASSVGETNVKATLKRTISGAVTKKSTGKTRSNVKKVSSQDENAVPITQINKVSKAKSSKAKGLVLGSKLLSNKDDPLHSSVLTMKSPVLRDRTNTTNELVKVDTVSKVSDKVSLDENKKSTAKRTTRNTKKQSALKPDTLKLSIEKYVVKLPKAQAEDHNKNSLPQKEDLPRNKKAVEKVSEKTDINENVDKSQEKLASDKSISETTPATKNGLKRKNISMQDVEKLLNEDDDDEDVEGHETSEDEETESVHKENVKNEEQKAKKFFKYKGTEEESKPAVPTKKPSQAKKGRAAKKTKNNDSTFSPKTDGPRQSTKPESKKLRSRVAKDYCETSRLSNSKGEAKENAEIPAEIHQKGVPIYKTIKLSQEEKKGEPEGVYEFDASQDDGQKGKKRKKTVKRPAVKRAKKTTNLPFGSAPLPRKKPAKTATKNVQFKVENTNKVNTNAVLKEKKVDNAINAKKDALIGGTETDCMVPDDLPELGDSAFAEAPTIRIVGDQKLEGSSKYRLTSTPSAPKTGAAGLKVFAPKIDTSQPSQQLKKMANHSLFRESMSPIKKINDEFDAGSPWRVADTFTRVRRIVQSTPQVNRKAPQQTKKPLEHVADLNKKSFGSEETIHLSAAANNKSPAKERSLDEMSTIKQDEPRKFGTVISNLSPSKSTSTAGSSHNSTAQRSPPQGTSLQPTVPENNQQSPAKAISPPSADPNLPVNYKRLDLEDPTISFDNKENISPKSSPKKKIVAPSPFRFEKIRSSKRLAAIASTSKTPEKASPAKNVEPEPEAGPSWLDKPKPAMKQTNLNNFLNLDEMPESANISTPHGIFDDVCSTPVSGRKPRKLTEEANVENAFGFDELDSDDAPSVESVSNVKIATEADVKKSVKGKLFPKARVKSAVPSRISENTVKKALVRNVLKKKVVEKAPEIVQEEEDSDNSAKENEEFHDQMKQIKESEKDKKKIMLDAISFTDTFDVLSETGDDLQAKVPEEMPLFVDLEPAHFSEPPRRSYNKRKRNVCFDEDRYESSDDDSDEHEKKKARKKKSKEPHLNKEEKKRMEDWVKNVNKTFDEIEHFDLVVE